MARRLVRRTAGGKGYGDEYWRQGEYRRDRVRPNMRQEYQGNVGFEPGQIGTRPPLLTKLDFQYQVYEAWYMEEDYNFFLRHSLSFMLTFWWLCTFIVSLTFLALALTFIPGYFELGGSSGWCPPCSRWGSCATGSLFSVQGDGGVADAPPVAGPRLRRPPGLDRRVGRPVGTARQWNGIWPDRGAGTTP